jgi:hypothetical protein
MNRAYLRSALALCLALATCACAATPATFERLSEESDPVCEAVTLDERPRLGVVVHTRTLLNLRRRVIASLASTDNFAVVLEVTPGAPLEEVDLVVHVRPRMEGEGKGYNFFTCFPGFLVFAHIWGELRWDLDLHTTIETKFVDSKHSERVERHDRYHLAYTPAGYMMLCNTGWGWPLFTGLAAVPLGTGIAAIFDGPTIAQLDAPFSTGAVGVHYARSVANRVCVQARDLQANAGPR